MYRIVYKSIKTGKPISMSSVIDYYKAARKEAQSYNDWPNRKCEAFVERIISQEEKYFQEEQAKLLAELPKEFHEYVTSVAWDRGHSCGYNEVLMLVEEMVNQLKGPIAAFRKRIS